MQPANPPESTSALNRLTNAAVQPYAGNDYAGDISPEDAWQFLAHNESVVVDVRTHPEWLFVGTPDLNGTPSRLVQLSWKNYPTFAPNAQFAEQFQQLNLHKDMPVFFICRSGGRSMDAAVAMTSLGYNHCFNIIGGFEGEPDASSHRGNTGGWKLARLPWRQG